MQIRDLEILALVLSSFGLFGGVLAWGSWMEWRETRARRPAQRMDQAPEHSNIRASVRRVV